MRFEVSKRSDVECGRVGADVADPPVLGARYNQEEQRWELEVSTLEQLLLLGENRQVQMIVVAAEQPDLPQLYLLD